MTSGQGSAEFLNLLTCMNSNSCIDHYPQDGLCLAKDSDAVQNLTSLSQIKGDWWVVKGVNCGQTHKGSDKLDPTPKLSGTYPGAYDRYPCQHERIVKSTGHDYPNPTAEWVNNITYCGGENGGIKEYKTNIIDTVANISLTSPGVIHHLYTDAPLLPQDEYWRVVSWPHPDWMLVIWCGNTPLLPYNGGIVLSRASRSLHGIPKYVDTAFRAKAAEHSIVYDQMCPRHNEGCP